MTTSIDICNRALVMMGSQNKIASLTQDMLEADVFNAVYSAVQDWCFSAANWNFARYTTALTLIKAVTVPTTPWTNIEPSPPWVNEFALPNDFIKALYITNSSINSNTQPGGFSSYFGEPKRFVISGDTTPATAQVLLTNESGPILVYTARVTDPTQWPIYFERFVVSVLAWSTCLSIMRDAAVFEALSKSWAQFYMLADQINREQGLVFGDTTPEWLQAIGIDYPFRRRQQSTQQAAEPTRRQRDDNSR
jgi:hypothetical protein